MPSTGQSSNRILLARSSIRIGMKRSGVVAAFVLATSGLAFAGMTSYSLNDVYRLRFQELSFFLLLLGACASGFRWLWNGAVKELALVPHLKWRQAFCLSLLLGVVMLLVLTMISGIREVLTPGAWKRQGSSYRLNAAAQQPVRRHHLVQLRSALFAFAESSDGRFPVHDFTGEVPEKLWEAPDGAGSHYIYIPGLSRTAPGGEFARLLALEPANFGDERFVLFTSGEIRKTGAAEVERLLSGTTGMGEP
ncbi:MAG: hypothetical protein O3C21_02125 [Verrucomicrobia bacterium]|nr:hypothetical protein [Verrucomicrobiota bacterium]